MHFAILAKNKHLSVGYSSIHTQLLNRSKMIKQTKISLQSSFPSLDMFLSFHWVREVTTFGYLVTVKLCIILKKIFMNLQGMIVSRIQLVNE